MKKYLLFAITMLVTKLSIHAQNTFPASGKVGIGTTSPLTLLHVKGVGSFGANITTANATRVLNLADANAVMRILRVHATNAPAIELLSRASADGANIAYWDMYAEPSDKSFRIRDRITGSNLDRLTINNSGNVGIGTTAPNASSILELNSTTKGFLTPRMTTAQRNAIGSPAQGLLIFQTDGIKGFYYYDAGWKPVASPSGGSGANTSLSNLSSPTAVNQHLLPQTTKIYDLGSNALSWRNLYLRDDIYLDGTRFVSNAPGTASFNAFVGSNAGLAITSAVNNTALGQDALRDDTSGSQNTAVGTQALLSNRNGAYNTASGFSALFLNASGKSNTASGAYSLYANNADNNTAIGFSSLANNTSGADNTATGYEALFNNTAGYLNTANGYHALYSNTTGINNTAVGDQALSTNTSGHDNAAIGLGSLVYNTTGSYNTAIGEYSGTDHNHTDLTNTGALGFNAQATTSNNIVLGNSSTMYVLTDGDFQSLSDGRFKSNIKEEVKGLEFINLLRPVVYNFEAVKHEQFKMQHAPDSIKQKIMAAQQQSLTKRTYIRQTGLIAQEVEQAAKKAGYAFSGVHVPENSDDAYSLSYEKLVVPLIKAVQELSRKTEEIDELKARLAKLEAMLTNSNTNSINVSLAYLEQPSPNPAGAITTIRYGLPESNSSAKLILTNAKGQLLKTIGITSKGPGQVNLNTASLPSGVYTYSLWIDGQQAAARQLVIAR